MRFGILGPLLVQDGESVVHVRGPKQRVLLAALALHAGNLVPAGMLTEVLWDGSPPAAAADTLRSYVHRLRRALREAGPLLVTRRAGYVLDADPDDVDALRFRALCQDGGGAVRDGNWEGAHAQLAEAARLWRGEVLADVDSRLLLQAEGPGLEALRLQAEEWRADAALHLGRHAELVPDLQALAARHPLRERFHGQLMVALYRSGRQAEALAAYQRAADLGIERGTELRDLQQQILSRDPSLELPGPARTTRAERPRATPRELPPAVPGFTGRAAELAALTAMLDEAGAEQPGTVVISAIGGTAGVGKTALALHWAHQVAGRFSDGQLHVNLRGFAPGVAPATPAEAIRGFLDALGVPPEQIPASPDAQASLYRSLLAGRKMLIVADNARDEDQVRPLLPDSPGSLVLVTSRNQMSGLAAAGGARMVSLDILPHDEATQLLTARIGTGRATAEPAAVAEIAVLCAHLPLALAVAAARAAARPGLPLAALAAELHGTEGRLDALDAGDPAASVRAVFSWSYSQLSPDAARMFRLLGVHPGPDISVPAAASLAATDQRQARRLLGDLTRASLITEHSPGRHALHDLLRAYAADLARATDSEEERAAAITRILDHYLYTADRGSGLLRSSRERVVVAPPSPGTRPEQLASHRQALAWFAAEHHVLLAVIALAAPAGLDRHAWQLPFTMTEYLRRRGHAQERVTIAVGALAAVRPDDTRGQAISLRTLGSAFAHAGDPDQGRAHLKRSLPLFQQLGDPRGEAMAHLTLSHLASSQPALATSEDGFTEAARHGEQALGLARAAGDHLIEAIALNNMAWGLAHLQGGYQRARELCDQSLTLIEKLGGCSFECDAWDTLGFLEYRLGEYADAARHYEIALGHCRDYGDRLLEAEMLTHLGDARHAAGDREQAGKAWKEALDIYDERQHPRAGDMREKLAGAGTAHTGMREH